VSPYKIEINDEQDIAYALNKIKNNALFVPEELIRRFTNDKLKVCEEYTIHVEKHIKNIFILNYLLKLALKS
jgi:hypothetical protein